MKPDFYLTHNNTRQLCVAEVSIEWFQLALTILIEEGSDEWSLFLKGA